MKSIVFIPALMLLLTSTGAWPWWKQIPGSLKHITATLNYVWGVNNTGDVLMCVRPCSGGWIHVPGKFKQVDADEMEVWGVTCDNRIYKRPVNGNGSWVQVYGLLTHVSASGNGYIWGVNDNIVGPTNNIYRCKKPCAGDWEEVEGNMRQIDGGFVHVCAVNDIDGIYEMYVDDIRYWYEIPGKLHYITPGKNTVFGVNSASQFYHCSMPCFGEWVLDGGSLIQVDAAVDAVFGVNQYDEIYRKFY